MDKQLAREFRERWDAAAAVDVKERQSMPIALRWQQMNATFQLAMGLGLPLKEMGEDEHIVHQRWGKLKGDQT